MGLLDSAHKEIVGGGGILNLTRDGDLRTDPAQWDWLPRTDEIVYINPYETYTISVTLGSTAATLDSAPGSSRTDWFMVFDSSIYRIAANTGTSVTLDSNCASTTGDYSVKVYKQIYDLTTTDVIRNLDDPYRMSPTPKQIGIITDDKITDTWQFRAPIGSLVEQIGFRVDSDNDASIVIPSISDRAQRIKLRLLTVPEELDLVGSDPILPRQHRKMIAHLAAYYHLTKRENSKAIAELQNAKALFQIMNQEYFSKLKQQGKHEFAKPRMRKARPTSGGPSRMRIRRIT
jgi:hypothetical protein